MKIAYFGGEPIGIPVLEELKACGITPNLIVCSPDRASGRKLELTPPPVKVWAENNSIETFQPESLKDQSALERLTQEDWDLFVVVAYNHIMPEWLIELPKHKTINLHPSLLPQYRGPSPIRTAILEDNRDAIGVSIMLLDAEMDHGPLLTQTPLPISDENWPVDGQELDMALARLGGATLADTIPKWFERTSEATAQKHDEATYTQKFTKADGEVMIDPHNLPSGEEARDIFLKFKAFSGWPGIYFFHNEKRIKVTGMEFNNQMLQITSVVPEGKKEIAFSDWLES